MRRLSPIHGLTLIFLVGLVLVVLIFRSDLPLWRSLLFRYTTWIGLALVLQVSTPRCRSRRVGDFIHAFSPILFVILIYQSLGDLIQYLHADIDPVLIRIDFFLFGVHPTVWMERWIVPWLTDLLSIAYGSYYFLPVVLLVVLYGQDRREAFGYVVFVLLFGYYVSFVGYILFPAVGPRYTLTALQSVPLEGSMITDFVRDVLNALEHNKRDCMPSGHTQIALMVLWLAYRFQRGLFWAFLPFVVGLVFSTIYHRYHYVIDLFAGAGVAIACLWVAPRIYGKWTASPGKPL